MGKIRMAYVCPIGGLYDDATERITYFSRTNDPRPIIDQTISTEALP